MKLYNSLSKKLERLKPLKAGKVGLYTCGPTVYDHIHIGNLRTYIFEDILRRTLSLNKLKVQHVMNLTDVDDKTIRRSHERYPKMDAKTALYELTRHYESVFLDDANKVGIDFSQTKLARATEHIDEMQELVKTILNKYITNDGVYFDIGKYPDYGVFENLDTSHEHHRINNDEYDKEHVADFVLWKIKKDDEPSWTFELEGEQLEGRPGWHLECSAMATKYLGQPFDIHTGGVDLKFPHHENEIAQSKSASGKNLANYFVHAEHLLVDGKKMSKSLQNFYTLEDILQKGFSPMSFRLLTLQAHYRSQLNFTWKSLKAAQNFLSRLYEMSDRVFQEQAARHNTKVKERGSTCINSVIDCLSNDLDTPKALVSLSELADFISMESIGKGNSQDLILILTEIDKALGLNLSKRKDINSEEKAMIAKREELRNSNDFSGADKIRGLLKTKGILLNDTPRGTFWYRII